MERAEDLAGVGIAVVIWASAAFAGYESIRKLIDHGHTSFVGAGIASAVLAIVGNQAVARYKMTVGRSINSATLVADAQHSWLDAVIGRGPGRAHRSGPGPALGRPGSRAGSDRLPAAVSCPRRQRSRC